jgi:[FeFe] hydrogenase H-cluster maturation GTPase HydF
MTRKTPKGFRLHVGIFGRRNVGKSSLLNAVTRQQVSLVSDVAGTTTDPVEKPMELLPLGPVLFIDTAGVDDVGSLGEMRVARTRQVFDRTDVGVIVCAAGEWGPFEDRLLAELRQRETPVVVVFNKSDLAPPADDLLAALDEQKVAHLSTVANRSDGVFALREALIAAAPDDFVNARPIIGDLVAPGDTVVLVTPIDKEAPKGRLILPEVQTIRDLLDSGACCMVVKETELTAALARLSVRPTMVVTDSQAFEQVCADTPADVMLTSFSILFARAKGDLAAMVAGAAAIDTLKDGDRVLVAEACCHHPIADDIGRVKIPKWLQRRAGARLEFTTVQGRDFPDDLSPYSLVVHCGACMFNRREVLSRVMRCRAAGVPITNYGLTIAYTLGMFERALQPFPDALAAYARIRDARPCPDLAADRA